MKNLGSGGSATIDAVIGEAIKQRRSELGIDIEDFASLLRVDPSQVDRYEAGIDRVGAELLMLICKALKVRPKHFFDALSADITTDR